MMARRFWPLWLALLATLWCGVQAWNARVTADMSAFLPQAPTPEQQLFVNQLRDGLVSRLILVGIEGGDESRRAAVSLAMAERLKDHPALVSVANGNSDALAKDQAFLMRWRYHLSGALSRPEHLSVAGLRQSVGDTLDWLASPAGLLVKSLLTQDPTGEMMALLDAMDVASAPNKAQGVWASRDGQRAVQLAQTRANGADTQGQQAAMQALQQAFDAAVQAAAPNAQPALHLQMTGPGVFGVTARDTIEREVTRLSLVGIAGIVCLLLVVYRSPRALALGLIPVVAGALAGFAAVSATFGMVHGITLGFGTTLIGEAVDYAIYLFVQSRGQGSDPDADGERNTQAWVQRFWPTVRLGVMTPICGLASLLFSSFPGLAQLGLYSIAGLVAAALVTRFVLPLLLPAGFRVRDVSALGAGLAHALRYLRPLRWLPWGVCLVAAALVWGQRAQLWNSDLSTLSPLPATQMQLDTALRADLGAPDVRYVLVLSAPTQEEALLGSEAVVAALEPLVQRKAIASVDAPSKLLPSQATQRARMAHVPDAATLQQRLAEAMEGMPLRAAQLAPFVAQVQAARTGPLLQRADLEGTSLALAVDGMLVEQPAANGARQWTAFLPLRVTAQGLDADAVREAMAASSATAGARLVDMKSESDRLYSGYLQEASWLSAAGLLAIVLLLWATLRSVRRVARVMVPLAASVLCVMAVLVTGGQSLTILHLVGLLLVVAVGSNYALFFESLREVSHSTFASLLLANLTTVLGFGVLAFASVPVLQAMGITVAPGAILALLFAAMMAPPTPQEARA